MLYLFHSFSDIHLQNFVRYVNRSSLLLIWLQYFLCVPNSPILTSSLCVLQFSKYFIILSKKYDVHGIPCIQLVSPPLFCFKSSFHLWKNTVAFAFEELILHRCPPFFFVVLNKIFLFPCILLSFWKESLNIPMYPRFYMIHFLSLVKTLHEKFPN